MKKINLVVILIVILTFMLGVACSASYFQEPRPPLKCDIYQGSNGKYYTQIETFERSPWGEDTAEEALTSARDSLKRHYERKNRTFKLIGSQTITGD